MTPHRPLQFFVALLALHETTFPDLPWSVISYGRSPLHNAAVGGADDSRHLDWEAADIVPDIASDIEPLKTHVKAVGLHYADSHPGALHVQLTGVRPRAA